MLIYQKDVDGSLNETMPRRREGHDEEYSELAVEQRKALVFDDWCELTTEQRQALGFDWSCRPLSIDNIEGPLTKEGSFVSQNSDHPLVQVALRELLDGAREIGGNNAGHFVAKYNRRTYQPGKRYGSWCAWFVSWCLRNTYGKDTPYVGGARALRQQMLSQPYGRRVKAGHVKPGDLIFWKRGLLSWQGHVGIVHSTNPGKDKLFTIEGNVGRAGRVRVFQYTQSEPHRGEWPNFLGLVRYTKEYT